MIIMTMPWGKMRILLHSAHVRVLPRLDFEGFKKPKKQLATSAGITD
jgi:hypothetical protein